MNELIKQWEIRLLKYKSQIRESDNLENCQGAIDNYTAAYDELKRCKDELINQIIGDIPNVK